MRKFRSNVLKKAKKRRGFMGTKKTVTAADAEMLENDAVVNSEISVNNEDVNVGSNVNNPSSTVNNQSTSTVVNNQSTTSTTSTGTVNNQSVADAVNNIIIEECEQNSTPQQAPIDTTPTNNTQSIKSISSEKLRNSAFSRKFIGRTRSQTLRLDPKRSKLKRRAKSFKIIDADLLATSISSAAICRKCRSPKSRLELLEILQSAKDYQKHFHGAVICVYTRHNVLPASYANKNLRKNHLSISISEVSWHHKLWEELVCPSSAVL